jgi:hypothetical protein
MALGDEAAARNTRGDRREVIPVQPPTPPAKVEDPIPESQEN